MTQYAAGSKTLVDNGREKRTDGLHKHLGMSDVGTLRVTSDLTGSLLTGHGVETCMGASLPLTGIIQALDRDAAPGSRYLDLIIGARNISISAQQGGVLTLPANSIGTSQIQSGAVQQYIAGYVGNSGYTTPSAGPWYETPIQATGTFSGAIVRIEWALTVSLGTAGSYVNIGLGKDGSPLVNIGIWTCPTANYTNQMGGVYYDTPSAGSHRYAIFLAVSAGVATLHSSCNHTLHLVEQKR